MQREFAASRPDQLWVADFTYLTYLGPRPQRSTSRRSKIRERL